MYLKSLFGLLTTLFTLTCLAATPTTSPWQVGNLWDEFYPQQSQHDSWQLTAYSANPHRHTSPEGTLVINNINKDGISSQNKFLYGYLEVRAKLTTDSKIWLYSDLGASNIVLAELNPTLSTHFANPQNPSPHIEVWHGNANLTDNYHVYGLEWKKDKIRWYLNNELIREVDNSHHHEPMYFKIAQNKVVESNAGFEAPMPSALISIDYVRTWQALPSGTITSSNNRHMTSNIDSKNMATTLAPTIVSTGATATLSATGAKANQARALTPQHSQLSPTTDLAANAMTLGRILHFSSL